MGKVAHPLKAALRKKMQNILDSISSDSKKHQSEAITKKVISSEAYKKAERISVYLSISTEVDTTELLKEMFKQGKHVFVPTYTKSIAEMVRLHDMCDYESLPKTKQDIKQPSIKDDRENALTTGGIDLFIVPGVAFTLTCNRMGHGMGFYDDYFKRHFETYPERSSENMTVAEKLQDGCKSILMALAFKEQIVSDEELPLEKHDVKIDYVVIEDGIYTAK